MARPPAADRPDEDLDFDLRIRPTGAGSSTFTAYVANSPAGNAESVFQLPVRGVELENFLLRIGQPRRPVRRAAGRGSLSDLAKSFGGQLFESVFVDDVATCLRTSEDLARSRDRRLRIRLRVSNAPILSDLPWEFLYDRRRNRFLALSQHTPLIREMDLSRSPVDLVRISPLRILVVISSPSGYDPLDTDREWTLLQSALADVREGGSVVVDRLELATLEQLRSRLRRSSWHVLHFIGHGGLNAEGGLLVFENGQGEPVEVSAEELGITLNDHRTLRLVWLNACEGARADVTNPFAGTAQQLMQQGIPAVVAMQFEITDNAAIMLAHEFYRALADGYALDESLTEARKAIRTEVSEVEWATPVLYLRGEGARLFTAKEAAGPLERVSERPTSGVGGTRFTVDRSMSTAPPSVEPPSRSRARRILDGAQAVTEPVRRTFGPLARPVVVEADDGSVRYTTDSREAAHSVSVESLEERIGADLIHTLIDEMQSKAGDGAASAAILATELIAGLTELVEQGAHPQALSRAIESRTTAVLELISSVTSDIEFKEQIETVGTTSTYDPTIGEIVAEAWDKVGREGAIVTEESNAFGLELQLVEGMQFDRGYLSPHFVTDEERGTVVLSDPYILLVSSTISAIKDLLPLLEKVIKTGSPLVVIAQDVDDEALSTLVVNKARGTFASVAVRAPDFGDRRNARLQDLAIQTGATVIANAGPTLEAAELDVLGRARSVVITQDSTTIVDAAGDPNQIVGRVNQLRTEVESSDSDVDREKLQMRLATLAGGVAVIRVGGRNQEDISTRRDDCERAVRLSKSAIDHGIVPGGGKALAVTATRLAETAAGPAVDQALVVAALRAPLRQLAVNAGVVDVDDIVERVGDPSSDEIFDARTGQLRDLASSTVLDSADVVGTVVQSATACARRFLSVL